MISLRILNLYIMEREFIEKHRTLLLDETKPHSNI